MRKVLIAIVSLAIGSSGLLLLYFQLFVWGYIHAMALMAVGLLLAVGFGWFWVDVLRPAITGRDDQ
ncbi:hypothetical protein FIV06_15835 [Labrenzia sp. THAF191b]|nr:hypothetical protein FIV06_15835 [Labrenzia sp. THAF191b]QFT05213.1 hypothetical protein FIV05_15830 [Labrenzia sp. THAF191a]QFT16757.1 hypothetical protein FIV03_15845 [Labrenzia sp. THAF187b]